MLKIKLRKKGKKKLGLFEIISIDTRKMFSKKFTKLGEINKKEKRFNIKIKTLSNEIKKGAGFSYGVIKILRSIIKNKFLKKYEIKIN